MRRVIRWLFCRLFGDPLPQAQTRAELEDQMRDLTR